MSGGTKRDTRGKDEGTLPADLTPEIKAALLALPYDKAMDALEREDPGAVALATEYILSYSQQVGELLKQGKDYLDLLAPSEHTPALERIAMELVLETAEEELDSEESAG